MSKIPFSQRFGIDQEKPVDSDFPHNARIALAHLLVDLDSKSFISDRSRFFHELFRTGRYEEAFHGIEDNITFFECILEPLKTMKWWRLYTFCERIYEHLLCPTGYVGDYEEWVETESLSDVRKYYTEEINNLLFEENLAYHFVNGQFQRRGRAQTQKSIQRMGSVLVDPSLNKVRKYYNKARAFFDERPNPDSENCVKEAICALEACMDVVVEKGASKDFKKTVKKLSGNDLTQIPQPIAEALIKLHAYRGSGQGVAHASLAGVRVSELEAELILNLVASYITYLVDLLSKAEKEIPF